MPEDEIAPKALAFGMKHYSIIIIGDRELSGDFEMHCHVKLLLKLQKFLIQVGAPMPVENWVKFTDWLVSGDEMFTLRVTPSLVIVCCSILKMPQ